MTTRDDASALIQRMQECFNTRQFDQAADLHIPGFFSHPLGTTGFEAGKDAWRTITARFPTIGRFASRPTPRIATTGHGTTLVIPVLTLKRVSARASPRHLPFAKGRAGQVCPALPALACLSVAPATHLPCARKGHISLELLSRSGAPRLDDSYGRLAGLVGTSSGESPSCLTRVAVRDDVRRRT